MDENEPANKPDLIQVTTPSSQYTIVAGSRTEIEVLLSNSGSGDFFIVNLLGVPPGWVESSGPSAVWVPADRLFAAMAEPIGPDAGTRGFLLIRAPPKEGSTEYFRKLATGKQAAAERR